MPVKYKVQQGDTLNDIANRHGFANYKEAGIGSVPSGNFDLIRAGEEIEIGNAKSGVSDINTNPIVTSQDAAQGFKNDSTELDNIINAPALEDDEQELDDDKDKIEGSNTGNELFDSYRNSADAARDKADAEAQEVLDEYNGLYELELAAIDARTRATTKEIKRSFGQRINEQKRINKVNVDRVKAYGLSSGSAQYTPIAWTDAISERERKGAEEIQGLERQRQELIDAARAAQDESDAALLSDKIRDYNAVKDKLNARLKEIAQESKDNYEELRKLREEEEAKFKEKQQTSLKKLQAQYQLNQEELEDLSDDELEQLVNKEASRLGVETYEVLGALNEALKPDYENLKNEAELAKIKAQTGSSNASAAAAYALAAKRNRETSAIGSEKKDDFTTAQNQTLEQAGLQDAGRQQKLDFLKMDEIDYEEKYPNGVEESGGGEDLSDDEAYKLYLEQVGG